MKPVRYSRIAAAIAAAVLVTACASHAPSSLTPAGVTLWRANEAQIALGTIWNTAKELNKVQICEPAPCHPLLSNANTRVVADAVESGVKTIEAVPSGWKATAIAALDQVEARLDAAGKTKLVSYVRAAREIVNGL